jgi:hypothetical protein
MDLEREHPDIKQSLLKSLSNVQPRHLLDRRLNPPAPLEAQAPVLVDAEPVAVGHDVLIPLPDVRR